MTLQNTRVAVVGGTSGIGFAVAQAALAERANVVIGSSQESRIKAAKDGLPGAEGFVIDVKNEASVASFFERVGAFDHLVYTAGDWEGLFAGGAFENLDLGAAASVFSVRFWGAIAVAKHASKHIRAGGSITLTDGMIAHRPRKGAAISSAMAGALEHLTRGLAVELSPIRVNAVCPGLIRTDVWNALIPAEHREEFFKQRTKRLPIARTGEPTDVVEAYLYLMRGGYTTAQVLRVDGGETAI
jgi:NAD(P)-dependent dehydrogenase (short-subunit alcohol dehydrogenase family)